MKNPLMRVINLWRTMRTQRNMPLRLEFVVTDYCNLNCAGCTHYSPLAEKEFESLERLRKTMAHLARVCGDEVSKVYLIGGETLLYPHLTEAMRAMRSEFATQTAYVFTNGLMLGRMSEEFWETAREGDFVIALTRYPINFDYDEAERLCAEKGVRCEVYGDRSQADSFFRFPLDPAKGVNPRISHLKCYNFGCLSVVGDRLYPCSISGCVSHLNKAHGTNFEHVKGDWLEVSDIKSVGEIKRLRNSPVPFCGYCLPPEPVAYARSERKPNEWMNQ